jgi:hypothetical protein
VLNLSILSDQICTKEWNSEFFQRLLHECKGLFF